MMKIIFLGTGSAISTKRYSCSALFDDTLLVDAGAPLIKVLPQVGVRPEAVRMALITHHHADHVVGLLKLILYRAISGTELRNGLEIFGPPGTSIYIKGLLSSMWFLDAEDLCGKALVKINDLEDGSRTDLSNDIHVFPVRMSHGSVIAFGYKIYVDGKVIAYSGDTSYCDAIDELLDGAHIAILEYTDRDRHVHLNRDDILQIMAKHPNVNLYLNHVSDGVRALEGAIIPSDLEIFYI
jgi:ribonuclease BN (tRNA processing enzyme)